MKELNFLLLKNKMRKLLLLLLISTISFAQNANRKYISHSFKNNILEIKTSDGQYRIKPLSNNIVETSFIPNNETYNPDSHTVSPDMVKKVQKNRCVNLDNMIVLNIGDINVEIKKAPFQISYLYTDEKVVSERNGYTKKDSTEVIDFAISDDEELYGGGARALGMNRRGNRLQLYNRAHYGYETKAELMNFCIPLVISSHHYGIHFDNPAIGYLDLDSKKNNTLSYETISGRKTYQVIVGSSWLDITEKYTELTGKQPLPPRWAFGNLASRFGYHSQEEVEKTIRKFKQDSIPIDGIILDLYWFGKTIKGTMGNLDWDKDNFPNPDKMISDLNAKGVKTILITEPFILTTSSKWQEAVDKKVLVTDKTGKPATWDFYFGNTSVVDVFKPEGKDWFWNIYKRLINQGVSGMWGDLGEPEVFPSKVITTAGKADEVHNIYGHNWAKLIADGYKKDFPNQRPFILMRAGYSGSQRYGMIPWSGDVSRSWGGLQSQAEIALQMGMQGMAYMHSDLGGFAGDYFDNELYLRWLQYGVFQPIFRPHAQEEVASEVAYKDVETKAKAKKQVELRYQLMPYNYTMAFDNNQKGIPLMLPLLSERFSDDGVTSASEEYCWGSNFLIKPITSPGVTSTKMFFPKYSNWYDFYTGEKHNPGTTEDIKVSEDYIPTFVKGGSFIPMINTIQNTSEYSLDKFNLHYYYDETVEFSDGKLYNDDGVTPNAFEKGQYEIVNFYTRKEKNSISIYLKTETGKNFKSNDKAVSVLIHNIKAKRIFVNGQEQVYKRFAEPLQVNVILSKGALSEIKIEY